MTSTLFTFWWLAGCTLLCAVAFVVPARTLSTANRIPPLALGAALFLVAALVRIVPAAALQLRPDALVQFDIESYRIVAHLLRNGSDVYAHTDRYPYLPFEMYVFAGADWLRGMLGWPFLLLVKIPTLLADAGIAVLVASWSRAGISATHRMRSAWIYAFNPVTIAVTSIHGQFDCIPAFFAVAAMFAVRGSEAAERSTRTIAISGLLLGLGILSKTWPVIFLPLLAWHWSRPRWAQAIPGILACGAVVIAGIGIYSGIVQASPKGAIDAARNYASIPGIYGYPLIIAKLAAHGFPGAASLGNWVRENGQVILAIFLLGTTACILRQRLIVGAAVIVVAFYVFTPGWGYQYLAWGIPFVLLALPRPASVVFVGITTATAAALYYGYGGAYFWLFSQFGASSPIIYHRDLLPIPFWLSSIAVLALLIYRTRAWERAYWRGITVRGVEAGTSTT